VTRPPRDSRALQPERPGAGSRAPVAVIDIGTNSTKLLVGHARAGHVRTIHFERETTRLGEGLDRTHRIGGAAATRTIRIVRRFAAVARGLGAGEVTAVGTLALRAATNGARVAARIARETGVPVRVLTGREEAVLSFLSARSRLTRPRPYTFLIDIGGGSTELVVAKRGRVLFARSLPLGALRLTERHLHADPIAPREYRALTREIAARVARAMARFDRIAPRSIDLVACGGSATTALDMARGGTRRDYARVHSLTLAQVRRLERTCLGAPLAERRRLPGLPPDRADIIPAGIAVVLAVMARARKRSVWISDGGIREGVILDQAK
jgi:exopolyphosphatase/guanosine-5'-triphosphate,3'-diphosphate pyrophosphatase